MRQYGGTGYVRGAAFWGGRVAWPQSHGRTARGICTGGEEKDGHSTVRPEEVGSLVMREQAGGRFWGGVDRGLLDEDDKAMAIRQH